MMRLWKEAGARNEARSKYVSQIAQIDNSAQGHYSLEQLILNIDPEFTMQKNFH
jgi:hypothetical protein